MMTLAAFAALCEAYLGIWPNVELFCRLIYFKTQTAETIQVICDTASFYARKTADFPSIKGKESYKKWQRSFFYVKNLKEGADHINLPPFDASGPERDSWSIPLPHPSPDMEKILQRISTMQTEGGLEPADLLLAFVVARVSPLQRRLHKMCFLGSARDPTRHSSKTLSALEVARKVNRIADVKLQASWTWGLEPHDRGNPIVEVSLPDLAAADHDVFWKSDPVLRFFPSGGLYRRRGDVRGGARWPHARVARPRPWPRQPCVWGPCGPPPTLLRISGSLRVK
jgi:hypothetical protein